MKRKTLPNYFGRAFVFSAASLILSLSHQKTYAQCLNTSSYGTITAPTTTGASGLISTCSFLAEYSTLNSVQANTIYSSSIASGGYVTIRQGTSNGPVIAHGPSPLIWIAPTSGTYYSHWNTNASCGTESSCVSTFLNYLGPAPNVPPTPIQDPGTPDCATGTILTVTGSPETNVTWYWQNTPTGTSTTNPYTGPETVFFNGTYYLRAFNSSLNFWSVTSSSVTVSNFPTIVAPPAPDAAENPACLPGTTLALAAPPAGIEYYWQSTDYPPYSTSNSASTPLDVTTTGTYYAIAYDPATQCWSETSSLSVTIGTYIPSEPSIYTDYFICSGSVSQVIEAESPTSDSSEIVIGTNILVSGPPVSIPFTVPALPSGATNINAQLIIQDATALGNSWLSDMRVALTGAYVLPQTQLSTGIGAGTVTPNPTIINLPGFPTSGGAINFVITETVDDTGDDALYGLVKFVVSYDLPASTTVWYDAPTGGNLLGIGSSLEAIGTSVMPSPANPPGSTYEFYAESLLDGCSSASRTLINVNVNDVVMDIQGIDATCNNAPNGTFYLTNTYCGTAPFSFSVNGGPFEIIPNNLTPGTHTVVAQDFNGNLSATYTIVISGADGPSDIEIESNLSDQVEISWTVNGDETAWNIEWGLPGFTPGTGTAIGTAIATSNPYTITGLDGSTEYEIFVSANCGAGATTGDWTSIELITDCNPINAIGFCEDFEDISSLGCWKVWDANGDGDQWAIYTGYAASGNQSAGLYTDFNNGNNNDYLILPRMTLTGNEILSFKYRAMSAGEPNDFRVVLSTTGYNIADFTEEILPLMTVGNIEYKDTAINLSAYSGNVFIAFHVPPGGLDGWYLYIDDICIDICIPQAGIDGSINACRLDSLVDLNSVITSIYTHGDWIFEANQNIINGSDLNISTLANGSYPIHYIITTACTVDTTIATINVFNPSSAGEDGTITACKNEPVNLLSGLNGTVDMNGTWYNSTNNVLPSGAIMTPNFIGQYNYKYVTSNNVCPNDTATVLLTVSNCDWLSIEEALFEEVAIYPNPTQDIVNLFIPADNMKLVVFDVNGRIVVDETSLVKNTNQVKLTDLERGTYFFRITAGEQSKVYHVVKQ